MSMAEQSPDESDDAADQELIRRLRGGDKKAYEALWSRHVGAALRVARRILPQDAEDIVSESFIAVYDQIRRGNGPEQYFRAYLFTVIRNISARTLRARGMVSAVPDIDQETDVDGLSLVEHDDEAEILLRSFTALPQRWQRILWLTEVENAARPAIAKDMRLRPNAVSALHRRAKAGLRLQWLTERVPSTLREDPEHLAELLPLAVLNTLPPDEEERLASHLRVCASCSDVEAELRSAYRSSRGTTLSAAGFAALGVTLPAAASIWGAPTVAAAVVAAVAAVTLGSAGLITATIPPEAGAVAAPVVISSPEPERPPVAPRSAPSPPPETILSEPAPTVPPADPTDPDDLVFWQPTGPLPPLVPGPPPPSEGAVPSPADPDEDGAPTAPEVAVAMPSPSSFAPLLSGTAPVASTVAVDLGGPVYAVDPEPDGHWQFDLRAVPLPEGTHTASVWVVEDGIASSSTPVDFTVAGLTLAGVPDDVLIDLVPASTEGLVFTVVGPKEGTACVSTDAGQSARVSLDRDGEATRRIRFLTAGFYAMTFAVCDAEFIGPGVDHGLWVSSGLFDPWGEEPSFVIEDVDAEPDAAVSGPDDD